MNTTLRSTLAALLFSPTFLFAQNITTPRTPSPAASVSQTIGISTVEINYSRPAAREREIWGTLVPYGWNIQSFGAGNEAPWRSGANENTTITLSDDATIGGMKLSAGTYGLFFVINEDNSGEVVLSKDNQSWRSFHYDPAKDAGRAKITIRDHAFTERLTYDFINIDKTSAELVLNWEKKQFPVKVEFDVDAIVMANATEELKGVTGFSWQGYNSAARYAMKNKTNMEQGMKWAETAYKFNPTFATTQTKARMMVAQGKEVDADKLMSEALKTATEAEVNAYGYSLANQGKTKKAVEIMKMNTDNNPKSANAWDSLGEGHVFAEEYEEARACFNKALSLDPRPNVKANSEGNLKLIEWE